MIMQRFMNAGVSLTLRLLFWIGFHASPMESFTNLDPEDDQGVKDFFKGSCRMSFPDFMP